MSPTVKPKNDRPTVAVLGYGSQGRAIALNLSDSGYRVTVGLRARSKSRTRARREGIREIAAFPEAVACSDVVCMAFPDHLHGRVFEQEIAPHLQSGACLWFLHGLSVHFGFVKPSKTCDVIMIAPHGPGVAVRDSYLGDRKLSAFYAVHQNRSRRAGVIAVKLAEAVGIKKSRLVETTFADEAIGDMFGEQAVLCGGLAALIKNGFETLTANGLKPEHAYLEVAYQLDLIISLIKKHGIEGMFSRISATARYGSLVSGEKVIDSSVSKRMQKVYDQIATGKFTRKLAGLSEQDWAEVDRQLETLSHPDLEKAARKFSR